LRGGLGFSRRLLWGSDSLDDVQRKKLAVTYGVFVFLEENEGLETTRAWFFGANTRLEVSEFEALRDGEFDAVWHAPHLASAVQLSQINQNTTPSDVVFFDATAQPLPLPSASVEPCGCPFCCKPPQQ